MLITTSCSSSSVFSSSYSMLTSQPPLPLSLGQQLIERGMSASSVEVKRHLRTPTPVFSGNGLAGFFSPITLLVLNSSLSMFGWVCSWIALLSVFCSSRRILG
jgi:hypothetical protein